MAQQNKNKIDRMDPANWANNVISSFQVMKNASNLINIFINTANTPGSNVEQLKISANTQYRTIKTILEQPWIANSEPGTVNTEIFITTMETANTFMNS